MKDDQREVLLQLRDSCREHAQDVSRLQRRDGEPGDLRLNREELPFPR